MPTVLGADIFEDCTDQNMSHHASGWENVEMAIHHDGDFVLPGRLDENS